MEHSIIQHVYHTYIKYCKILSVNKDVLIFALLVDAYLRTLSTQSYSTALRYVVIYCICDIIDMKMSAISIIAYPHIAMLAIHTYIY